jgi:Mitochondrial ribosomal death-associated protein 3
MLGFRSLGLRGALSAAPRPSQAGKTAIASLLPQTPLTSLPAAVLAQARRLFSAEAAPAPADAPAAGAQLDDEPDDITPVTYRPRIPANVYAPSEVYDEHYIISESNPKEHTFADVGKYFPLGGSEGQQSVDATFPAGLAGDLSTEFGATGTNLMCVRPTGVFLVHALEHWRQEHGRKLASEGKAVKDIDPSQPYEGKTGKAALDELALPKDAAADLDATEEESNRAKSSSSPHSQSSTTASATSAAAAAAGSSSGHVAFAGNENPKKRKTSSGNPNMTAPFEWSRAELNPYSGPKTGLNFPPYRMLTGPSGIGKSALLNYAVAYTRASGNNWISVFVPDSFKVMKKGLVLVQSKRRPGMVDQHDMALTILRDTLLANRTTLSQVHQRGKYATFRYLPREQDAIVSQERELLRKQEEAEKAKLKAQADAAGTVWDPSTYKSK